VSDFEEQFGLRAKVQPIQDWCAATVRARHFFRKRTKRPTDDPPLGPNELLNAPGVYGWVGRTCLCEPSVRLFTKAFPGPESKNCPAECGSHQHGGHAEAERRGKGDDASDGEAERGGHGVRQRRVKGCDCCVVALIPSHAHRMDYTVVFSYRVAHPFLGAGVPRDDRRPRSCGLYCVISSGSEHLRGWTMFGSEPSAPLEERDEREYGEEFGSDAEAEEDGPAADVAYHPVEVLTEEACDERERQKNRRDDGQLFHH
jgi:hypothetical protein